MTTHAVRFRDHEEFHRAALQMIGAGAFAGLVAQLAVGSVTGPLGLALIAGAAGLAAVAPAMRTRPHMVARLVLVALAVAMWSVLDRAGEPAGGLAMFGAGFAASLACGLRGRTFLLAVAGGALVTVFAHHALAQVAVAEELSGAPAWLAAAIAGTAFSMVAVVALLPRHIEVVSDPVAEAYTATRGMHSGEVNELCERGYALWNGSKDALPAGHEHRETLQEGVLRLFGVARSWSQADAEGAQTMASSLVTRLEELDRRIDAANDDVVKEQYTLARGALAQQLEYLQNIGTNRDRVLARMHNYLAAMERLRLAVINRDSAHASREGDVAPLLDDVEALGRDIDLSCEALVEIEGESADRATT